MWYMPADVILAKGVEAMMSSAITEVEVRTIAS